MLRKCHFLFLLCLFSTSLLATTDQSVEQLYQKTQKKIAQLQHTNAQKKSSFISMDSTLSQHVFSPYKSDTHEQNAIIGWYQTHINASHLMMGGIGNLFAFSRKIGGGQSAESGVIIHQLGLNLIAHDKNVTAVMQIGGGPNSDIFLGDLSYTYSDNATNTQKAPDFNIRQAYGLLTFANSHVYFLLGQKNIDFGQFTKVTEYNNPLTRQFFMANGTETALGWRSHHVQFTVSAINDNRSRDINLPSRLPDKDANLTNYAANFSYDLAPSNRYDVMFNAGYMAHGAIAAYKQFYVHDLPKPTSYSAVSSIGFVTKLNRLKLIYQYVTTLSGARLNSEADTLSNNDKVSAYNIAMDYQLPVLQRLTLFSRSHLSASYSQLAFSDLTFLPSAAITKDLGNTMSRWAIEWRKHLNQHWLINLDYINNNGSWDAATPRRFNQQKIVIAGVTIFF